MTEGLFYKQNIFLQSHALKGKFPASKLSNHNTVYIEYMYSILMFDIP